MTQSLAVIVASLAVIGALYVLARPHWGFVLVIVLFPFKQLLQVYVPFLAAKPTLVNFGVAGLVSAAVMVRSMRRERTADGSRNRITYLILALYGLWLIGIMWSPSRSVYLDNLGVDLSYQLLLLVFLPLLVIDIVEFRRMLFGLMVVGSIIALLVMLSPRSSYHSGRLVLDLGMVGGGMKDTGNPLATASMGASVALIAALIRPERATFLVTLLRVAAFTIGMGMAIGSGSRGQVLAAGIVGILFYPMSRKLANPKQFFIVIIGFLILVGGLYGVFKLFIGSQNQARWNPIDMLEDTTMRLEMAFTLFDYYLANPSRWLLGLGTGAYAAISHNQYVERDYVHNIAAEILCEHGIVGAILFVSMMVLLVKWGKGLWMSYKDDPSMRSTVAILCGFCVFTLLEALKQGSMHYPAPFYWWIVMAKLAHFELKHNPQESPQIETNLVDDALEREYAKPPGPGGTGDRRLAMGS